MYTLIESVLSRNYFHPILWGGGHEDSAPAIPWFWMPGKPGGIPLCLVLGPNGGGKSFFRRLVQSVAHEEWEGVECIHLSMEGRTGSNMYGAMRAMVYGSEGRSSTGSLSGGILRTGARTCQERSGEHFIYWDEPAVGMGEEEAAGAGIALHAFAKDLPEKTRGVFITTHSRHLVQALLPLDPHYVHLGVEAEKAPQSLQGWLDRPIEPRTLEMLSEATSQRRKAIQVILNAIKSEKLKESIS